MSVHCKSGGGVNKSKLVVLLGASRGACVLTSPAPDSQGPGSSHWNLLASADPRAKDLATATATGGIVVSNPSLC